MGKRSIEAIVGLFILAALLGLLLLAFRVSGLTDIGNGNYYAVYAEFDNVGGLRVRAPVAISGVAVGRVAAITLDPQTFKAKVLMRINENTKIPLDSTASIFTQGILGSNYVSLSPGFESKNMKADGMIQTTHSALILENLIGQLLFILKNDKKSDSGSSNDKKKE